MDVFFRDEIENELARQNFLYQIDEVFHPIPKIQGYCGCVDRRGKGVIGHFTLNVEGNKIEIAGSSKTLDGLAGSFRKLLNPKSKAKSKLFSTEHRIPNSCQIKRQLCQVESCPLEKRKGV